MIVPKVSISLLQHHDPPPSQKNPTNRFSSISMQSAGEERGRVCPSPSFYSEVSRHHRIEWHTIIWDHSGQGIFKKMVQMQRKTYYNMAGAYFDDQVTERRFVESLMLI